MAFDAQTRFADARYVSAPCLVPRQQTSSLRFKQSCDFRQQWMIKHPFLSEFHSRYEHLYAGLNEGNTTVTRYVPQPFMLYVRQERYKPDVYVEYQNQTPCVIEIKPEGVMDESKRGPLEAFFAAKGWQFVIVSNESIAAKEIEAKNWLDIVTRLHCTQDMDTTAAEYDVLDQLYQSSKCLGEIIDPGNREYTIMSEVAIYRLLHRGQINANLTEKRMDYESEVSVCH